MMPRLEPIVNVLILFCVLFVNPALALMKSKLKYLVISVTKTTFLIYLLIIVGSVTICELFFGSFCCFHKEPFHLI